MLLLSFTASLILSTAQDDINELPTRSATQRITMSGLARISLLCWGVGRDQVLHAILVVE
jgi:hypothetical protein